MHQVIKSDAVKQTHTFTAAAGADLAVVTEALQPEQLCQHTAIPRRPHTRYLTTRMPPRLGHTASHVGSCLHLEVSSWVQDALDKSTFPPAPHWGLQ